MVIADVRKSHQKLLTNMRTIVLGHADEFTKLESYFGRTEFKTTDRSLLTRYVHSAMEHFHLLP